MFLRFLFLAMLVVAAGPHDAIAEEPGEIWSPSYKWKKRTYMDVDVFGFKWKISSAEASKIASRPMKKNEKLSHYGKTVYDIENPKEPSDAESIHLWFFNDELYFVGIAFWIKDNDEFQKKMTGLVKFFESKHPEAKFSGRQKGTDFYFVFAYDNEADVIENPYNLEKVAIVASSGTVGRHNEMFVIYHFYGAEKIEAHIETMKNKKEFEGF